MDLMQPLVKSQLEFREELSDQQRDFGVILDVSGLRWQLGIVKQVQSTRASDSIGLNLYAGLNYD